jgi:hypothetical protein
MYKFTDWFIEYMKHANKYCNLDDLKNALCTEDVLKGRFEVLEKYPDFISCQLSLDKNSMSLLSKYPDKICWTNISSNPNAIPILEKYPEKINWYWLSSNPNAIKLIEANIDKLIINNISLHTDYKDYISWKLLHYNYEAIHILDKYKENINWNILSYVNHENVIEYLLKNVKDINWVMLSFNDCAHSIFITYPEYVNWKYLSLQPFAINTLTNNSEYIDWDYLSFNENAIQLLNKNYEKINWSAIMFNKNGKEIIKHNLDRINWTDWKIFTKLLKALDKLDKKVYCAGIDFINDITTITYNLKQNYKNNLEYFKKCFVYEALINIDDKEIINTIGINFYMSENYSVLLRDKTDCNYSVIDQYKHTFIKQCKQCDKPFAILCKEATNYIGPIQYNPINTIYNNIEFKNILENNPDKIEWVLKMLDNFGCDKSLYIQIIEQINIITIDYQKMALRRTHLLREELMMKVLHPSNIEKWLNSGFTIDDL